MMGKGVNTDALVTLMLQLRDRLATAEMSTCALGILSLRVVIERGVVRGWSPPSFQRWHTAPETWIATLTEAEQGATEEKG